MRWPKKKPQQQQNSSSSDNNKRFMAKKEEEVQKTWPTLHTITRVYIYKIRNQQQQQI